ncbi:MAG TPA: acetate/propionate family kinase [Gemmataceae bacterium]|jgi:acetate kinase|nr:acetate/propionate family kinase [Gemmataceae bacterium]
MPEQTEQIAVFNAGSSSLKFSIYQGESAIYQGLVDRLESSGSGASRAVIRGADRTSLFDGPIAAKNHDQALEWLFNWLEQPPHHVRPAAVGHRVVHGGDAFVAPTRVTSDVFDKLEALTPLAPLHQPHSLSPIRFLTRRFPELAQVACFDTAFHATQSRIERMYALPREYFDRGIKRYGFHGLSYEFIAGRLPEVDTRAAAGRTIVCHLGNGASLCALRAGRSVATSMGFTPLDGIPMGTRCGSISPAVLLHLLGQEKMRVEELSDLLYHRSGLLGISGISADMRDLLTSPAPSAAEAVEYFCYRIAQEIGSLAAVLGGLDAIVFTAGIGEHAARVRARVVELSHWLGASIDAAANAADRSLLHAGTSAVKILVIPTNEELMIDRHTRRVLAENKN